MEPITDILTEPEMHLPRRRSMLPWWIKIFTWIFIVFGAAAPVAAIIGIMGGRFQTELYGLSTDEPFSLIGFFVLALFLLKGVTALLLWFEKPAAIKLGLVDAITGIMICGYMMIVLPMMQPGYVMTIRLELVALIPYFIWLRRHRENWERGGEQLA